MSKIFHTQLRYDDQEFCEMFNLKCNQFIEEVDVFFDNISGYWVINAEVNEHEIELPVENIPF
jgi:hypothetical protein